MPHFKDTKNNLFWLDDADVPDWAHPDWRQITDAEAEALRPKPPVPTYAELRAAEYPPIGDQLDALWKGGADAAAMKAGIDGVKAKYPKP